ncbi:LacI family DNA-binding transcriptional regulator [Lacticaseibacillus zhaodongensis]|uniref:LacI family DNA-binding transcriptional regulator n=1 Tax=Lacticaseibacillus zhaodongensis TaxID=2668065 RepID=UPI0012D2AC58|nr:LacI family DNA-binding transcriptional regulator [Lacticaseibacillus zhaodongensis]
MATIHDVARISGYSLGTVSNVINHPDSVAATTRAKIEAVMASLDYTPNALARSLSLGRSRNIGVVLPNSHHPYFAYILNGITEAAFPTGYRVTLLPTNYDVGLELRYLHEFQQKAYAALIFTSRQMPLKELEVYSKCGQIVCCENVGDEPLSAAYSDRMPTYEAAFRWIWEHGYREVAILAQRAPDVSETTRDMLRAYKMVFGRDLGQQRLRLGITSQTDGYDAACFLQTTDPKVDFVLANGDDIAAGVLLAYRAWGKGIPGIMGTENQLSSRLLNFPTINHHLETLGHIAFSLAIRPGVRHQLVKSDFIVRN